MTWADSFLRTLKDNDVRLVTYVPDNVLTPLIAGAAADNYFMDDITAELPIGIDPTLVADQSSVVRGAIGEFMSLRG